MEDLREIASEAMSPENIAKSAQRDKVIIRTSIIGITANIFLAVFKAVVGLLSNSIAVTLDAVNNVSDAGSSLITIVGTKLAGKQPDKKHPWGYGRIEYLTAMVISVIVLYAGVTSLIESVRKLLNPEVPDYGTISLIIIAVGVIVKIVLGKYVKGVGEKVNSESLVNSGADALNDSIISSATFAAALIYIFTGVKLEAVLGAVISAVIIKSGIEMLRDTISEILGERIDTETAVKVSDVICDFPEVHGAYDLIFHDYGPDRLNCSAHIEIPDTMTAEEIDALIRRITAKVYEETGVIVTAIGIYSMNTQDEKIVKLRKSICDIVMKYDHIIQLHGFYVNEETKSVQFDIIVDFDEPDRIGLYHKAIKDVQDTFTDYRIIATLDTDFSLS